MDAFEAARQKHAKNLERKTRAETRELLAETLNTETPVLAEVLVSKEKTDAVIDVNVSLPTGDFSFTLRKRQVMQNVSRSKLTRQEFMNCLIRGLGPLLGEVKE